MLSSKAELCEVILLLSTNAKARLFKKKKKKNSEKIQSCSGNIDNKTNSEISKSDRTNIQSEYKASFLLSVNSPTCINLDLFSTYHHYVISKIKQCSNG